jgi:histidyl-tRNA synthetase
MAKEPDERPKPRLPAGVADVFGSDLVGRQRMIETICAVYRRFGFAPLETPAIEYLDALGKFLPEKDEPQGGVFAFKDDDGQWLSLRYDLTAPLSRFAAQYGADLPTPYRRYQVGPVWRREKPGPGRFRQFYQCDFDTVGTSSSAADAEVCAVLAAAIEALGIGKGEFQIRVNNRKLLNGVLEKIGLDDDGRRGAVLRAIDKLDRLGIEGGAGAPGKWPYRRVRRHDCRSRSVGNPSPSRLGLCLLRWRRRDTRRSLQSHARASRIHGVRNDRNLRARGNRCAARRYGVGFEHRQV